MDSKYSLKVDGIIKQFALIIWSWLAFPREVVTLVNFLKPDYIELSMSIALTCKRIDYKYVFLFSLYVENYCRILFILCYFSMTNAHHTCNKNIVYTQKGKAIA